MKKLEFGNPEHIRLSKIKPPKNLLRKIKRTIVDFHYPCKNQRRKLLYLQRIAERIKKDCELIGRFDKYTIKQLYFKKL